MIASKSYIWRKIARAAADIAEYADELAELELSAPDMYSTRNLPPDVVTIATFRRHAKKIPERVERGKWLGVPIKAWDAYRTKQRPDTVAPASEARPKAPAIDFAEQFRKAGMRTTRKGGDT